MKKILALGFVILVFSACGAAVEVKKPIENILATAGDDYSVVASLPVGEDGFKYQLGEAAGEFFGPDLFRQAPGGEFFLLDYFGSKLVQFDKNGLILKTFSFDELAIKKVVDVVLDKDSFFVLDFDDQNKYYLHQFSYDGKEIKKGFLSDEISIYNGLSGLVINEKGDLYLEFYNGVDLFSVKLDQEGAKVRPVDSFETFGLEVDFKQDGNKIFDVELNGEKIPFVLTSVLYDINFLGANENGESYFLVNEVFPSQPEMEGEQTIRVEQTIYYLDAEGRFLAKAKGPLQEQFVVMTNNFVIDPKNGLYALISRKDKIDLVKMNFFEIQP